MRNNHPPLAAKNGAKTRDSTAMSLIKMFSDGPEVSFKGSPTVSPITAALWASDPLGPKLLACSEFPACTGLKSLELEVTFSPYTNPILETQNNNHVDLQFANFREQFFMCTNRSRLC